MRVPSNQSGRRSLGTGHAVQRALPSAAHYTSFANLLMIKVGIPTNPLGDANKIKWLRKYSAPNYIRV
jgi:hypothetical protein